jgi:hypothetical protein
MSKPRDLICNALHLLRTLVSKYDATLVWCIELLAAASHVQQNGQELAQRDV